MSQGSESYQNLEGYVKGGGKLALLVSRDLTRVVGSCIKLARRSNRTLYRWDGVNLDVHNPTGVTIGGKQKGTGWKTISVIQDFEKLFQQFTKSQESNQQTETPSRGIAVGGSRDEAEADVEFEENSILWLPLRQPFLVQDGGEGSRSEPLLRDNMEMARWALKDQTGGDYTDSWNGKSVIIGGLSGKLPPELKSVTHIIRWEYPSRMELRELIFGQTGTYTKGAFESKGFLGNGCGSVLDKLGMQSQLEDGILESLATGDYRDNKDDFIEKMVEAAQGLDIEDCKIAVLSSFRESIENGQEVMSQESIQRVMNRKVQLLSSDGLLSIEDTSAIEEVGGYSNIDNEIRQMINRFQSSDGERFGVKKPKGVLLTGVPGCGKSLTAKTIARILDCPLLGFDLGKITTSLYGETEENMHRALSIATGMSPCVLWIDEFEKMFASASSNGGAQTHEVSQRINAIFLKWMEERKEAVFVVATSNDLSGIKAEYQRTGRWDGTYFFDLPSQNERKAILESLLKSKPDVNQIESSLSEDEISKLIIATQGWAGSDIAALIKESRNMRFNLWCDSDPDNRTSVPILLYTDVEATFNSGKITPMKEKDSKRLNRIRREGSSYTSASKYTEDDVPVPVEDEEPNFSFVEQLLEMGKRG